MVSFNVEAFVKKIPVPFLYGLFGAIAAEIPVLLNAIPPTFDGYSTAGVIGALTFIGGASVWIHNELSIFISSSTSSSSSSSNVSTSSVATPPVLAWSAFEALNGTASTASVGSVVATSVNASSGKTWYGVVGSNGTIVLTNIAPS